MDFMCPTGFASVTHNVMDRLTPFLKKHDIQVDIASLNFGDRKTEKYNDQILAVNPKMFAKNMDDYYYRDGVLKMLQIGDYDLFWAMNDINLIGSMSPILKKLKQDKKFKTLLYTPIDSVPHSQYFKGIDIWDEAYTYTKYGQKEIQLALKKEKQKNLTFGIIPHGIEGNLVRKDYDYRMAVRDKYKIPKDVFLFGNVNKNQPRKDIGGTLIAFAKFKETLPNSEKVALYLHCYHSDKSGIKIYNACNRLNLVIGVDVFLPIEERYVHALYTKEDMNDIYQMLDVFVSTSTAEGWGLTITEAMANGLPIVCGNHTSLTEITDNGKLVYAVNDFIPHLQIGDDENIRMLLHPNQVVEQMKKAYNDLNIKWVNSTNLYLDKYAHKFKEYQWDSIAKQWENVIRKMLKI
jgi:glycosyltransferase involved in cell wall biosynthesis